MHLPRRTIADAAPHARDGGWPSLAAGVGSGHETRAGVAAPALDTGAPA